MRSIVMKISAALLLVALIAACASSPTGRRQFLLMSDEDMNQMGAQAFTELKQKTPAERTARINAYVHCVTDALLAVTEDETGVQSWEMVVFRENSANAFALPGGKIGVHTGLLQVARTQGQLAAVIGHEIGHVIARHGNERVSQNVATQTGLDIVGGMSVDGPQRDIAMQGIGLGAQYGVLLPFSRAHETEADIIGQELMARAGFDPREAIDLWMNMSELSAGSAPPELASTHPASERRMSDLERNLSKTLPLFEQAQASGRNPRCGP